MKDYDELMINSHDGQTLYQNSPMRFNIVSWFNFKPGSFAFIVGEHCPVFDDFLREKGVIPKATFLEETAFLGFHDCVEYIFLMGMADEELIQKAREMLAEDGTLFIAIDNRAGLMYESGLPNFYTGRPLDSLKKRDGNHSATRLELQGYLNVAGLKNCTWYYPYPDFRLAEEIYSDDHLPPKNLVQGNFPSYLGDYMVYAEAPVLYKKAYDKNRVYDVMNSFFVVWSKNEKQTNNIEYAKFNWHRAPQFRLGTLIKKADGGKIVEKFPMCREAASRLDVIEANKNLLSENYNMLRMVPFERVSSDRLQFKFIEGKSLLGEIDFEKASVEEIKQLVEANLHTVFSSKSDNEAAFVPIEKFKKVFGEINTDVFEGMEALMVSNPDSIFDNFILGDSIYCLDYEWCFDFMVPLKYLKYRTLHYLYRENSIALEKRGFKESEFLKAFDYSEQEIKTCEALELAFQQYVHGEDLRYIYLPHYQWRAFTKEEWKKEKSLVAKIKRKLSL